MENKADNPTSEIVNIFISNKELRLTFLAISII